MTLCPQALHAARAARLIAAAPELLEALEEATEALEYASGKLNNPTINGHNVLIQRLSGARWDSECKAWMFESWAALEAAINNIGA